jgi:hypothetical protein
MKRELVITDVTRMQEGRVCVAGYDRQRNCVRPVLAPPGIHESSLCAKKKPIVFPFALVEYDLLDHIPKPPHTEDWRYDPASVRLIKKLGEKEKRETLERLCFPGVDAIFGTPIISAQGHYVLDGQGTRSLGTIRPRQILKVIHEQRDDAWKYRLWFVNGERMTWHLTITDLAWRYFCDSQRQTRSAEKIVSELTAKLEASQVYLRIGLARGWDKHPDRCYLQVTGVYSFPDYLEGRTFADFSLCKSND